MSNPVQKFKSFLLEPEYADANKRQMNKSYWGDSGKYVLEAIEIIERTIDAYPVDENTQFESWLQDVSTAIESRYDAFSKYAYDPDGYGCGTFSSCIRRLHAMQDSHLNIQESDSQ